MSKRLPPTTPETTRQPQTSVRVLIVDDFEPWRSWLRSVLTAYDHLCVAGEVADGLEAVHRAQALQPELILLDIGLPSLNGIAAARQISKCAPVSKILFLSAQRSAEIVREAMLTGAAGYVRKADAGKDLLPAIKAVLRGEQFISDSLDGPESRE